MGEDSDLDTMIDMSVKKILSEAQDTGAQFIVAGSNWLNGYCGWKAARILGLPFVYDARGVWHFTRSYVEPAFAARWAYDFQDRAEIAIMKASDHVFAISNALRDMAITKGVDESKVSVVPNMILRHSPMHSDAQNNLTTLALRNDLLGGDTDAILLLYAGSITPYERLEVIIKALSSARNACSNKPTIKFAVAGAGSHRKLLERLSVKLGVDQDVIWLGSRERRDLQSLIRAADFMVYPRAKHKAFQTVPPLKPLEPMSLGSVCVMSDIHPHRELAGEKDVRAFILSSDEPNDWLNAIYALNDNSSARSAMIEAAQEWVDKERNPDCVMQPWINLVKSLGT